MTAQAQLWIEGPLPGLNELIDAAKGTGGKGMRYAALKKAWTDTVWALAKQARLPAFPGAVTLSFLWVEANRRRDPDNVAAGGRKLVLDGLVKAGVLTGDGWAVVSGWRDEFYVDPEQPACLVTITDNRTARTETKRENDHGRSETQPGQPTVPRTDPRPAHRGRQDRHTEGAQ